MDKAQKTGALIILAASILLVYFLKTRGVAYFFEANRAESTLVATGIPGGQALVGVEQKFDINKATEEELTFLPGLGEVLARRILEKRVEKQGFSSIEELKEVEGIGERKLNAMRAYLKDQGQGQESP